MKKLLLFFAILIATPIMLYAQKKIKTDRMSILDNKKEDFFFAASWGAVQNSSYQVKCTDKEIAEKLNSEISSLLHGQSVTSNADYTFECLISDINPPKKIIKKFYIDETYTGTLAYYVDCKLNIYNKEQKLIKSIVLLEKNKPIKFVAGIDAQSSNTVNVYHPKAKPRFFGPTRYDAIEKAFLDKPFLKASDQLLKSQIITYIHPILNSMFADQKFAYASMLLIKNTEDHPEISAITENLRKCFIHWRNHPFDADNKAKMIAIADDFMKRGNDTAESDAKEFYYMNAAYAYSMSYEHEKACKAFAIRQKTDAAGMLNATKALLTTLYQKTTYIHVTDPSYIYVEKYNYYTSLDEDYDNITKNM